MSEATVVSSAGDQRDTWRGSSSMSSTTDGGSESSDAGDNVSIRSLPGASISSRLETDGASSGRSPLWSTDGLVADPKDKGASSAPWSSSMSEFSIWGSSSKLSGGNDQWDDRSQNNAISSMLQNIATGYSGGGPSGGVEESAWISPLTGRNGTSMDSLGLSGSDNGWLGSLRLRDGGGGAGSSSAFRPLPVTAPSDSWGAPGKQIAPKSAAADWGDEQKRAAAGGESAPVWPGSVASSSSAGEKSSQAQPVWPGAEPNGTAVSHARSSSATSESGAKEPGAEAPVPEVVPEPTAEEILISKMVNSNEGWGTRPIRQDTPWNIEVSIAPPLPLPPVTTSSETVHSGVTNASGQVWNAPAPRETPATGQYWGGGANPGAGPAEWSADGDIGIWNGPPPHDPNAWSSAQKDLQPQSGYLSRQAAPVPSGRLSVTELPGILGPPLGGAAAGWPDPSTNFASLPAGIIDKLALGGKDSSMLLGGQKLDGPPNAAWLSSEAVGASGWGTLPDATMRGPPPQQGARFGAAATGGRQFDMPPPSLKIDTWNDPPALTDTLSTGHWGQPPVSSNQGGANIQMNMLIDAQLQHLLKLGVKREDALQMLLANNPELMNPSRPGTSMGDMTQQQQRGRMVRGAGGDAMDMFGRLPPQQFKQSAGPNAQMMMQHQKQHSGGGWPPQGQMPGAGFPGGMNIPPPSVGAQMSPVTSAIVVQLQSILQPKLQQRSQVQQNRMMTAQQKRQQLDQLNAEISNIKQQIDQLQAPGSPAAAASSPGIAEVLRNLTGLHLGGGAANEAMLTQQLLNQLQMEQDAAGAQFRPGGPHGDFSRLMGPPPMSHGGKGGIDSPFGDWPTGAGGHGSRFPWPQDAMLGAGRPPIPPPGLGGDGDAWSRSGAAGGSSASSWGEKPRPIVGSAGPAPTWVFLSNFAQPVDGTALQALCGQYGVVQTFYFNKSSLQALACFMTRDDAAVATGQLGRVPFGAGGAPLCQADIVNQELALQLFNSQPAAWSQLPSIASKPRPGNIWGDAM